MKIPDFNTVDELMQWLQENGYNVPVQSSFPEGSTARTLFGLQIKREQDPAFEYLANVVTPWAPYEGGKPLGQVSVWVVKDSTTPARTAIGTRILGWLRQAGARLVSSFR